MCSRSVSHLQIERAGGWSISYPLRLSGKQSRPRPRQRFVHSVSVNKWLLEANWKQSRPLVLQLAATLMRGRGRGQNNFFKLDLLSGDAIRRIQPRDASLPSSEVSDKHRLHSPRPLLRLPASSTQRGSSFLGQVGLPGAGCLGKPTPGTKAITQGRRSGEARKNAGGDTL